MFSIHLFEIINCLVDDTDDNNFRTKSMKMDDNKAALTGNTLMVV